MTNYDLEPGVRRSCVADTGAYSGTGVQIDDGRVLYVYSDSTGSPGLYRGWAPSATAMRNGDDSVVDVEPLLTWSGGGLSACLSEVGTRLLLAIYKPQTNVVTGTAYMAAPTKGLTVYESVDNGTNWTALGSAAAIFGNSDSGLGTSVAVGQIVETTGAWLLPANRNNNYFGASVPSPAIWRSTDNGVTWSTVFTPLGGPFAGKFSRMIATDASGDLWWGVEDDDPNAELEYQGTSVAGGAAWSLVSSIVLKAFDFAYLYSTQQSQQWKYYSDGEIYTTDAGYDTDVFALDKVSGGSTTGEPAVLVSTTAGVFAFSGRWVDLVGPGSVTVPLLAPLRIPWPRWAADGTSGRALQAEQEHQNHIEIERWWSRTRKGIVTRLRVPFPRWAIDAGFPNGEQEHQNYLALERWADRWNASGRTDLSFPFRRWAEGDPSIKPAWVDREQENYLAIERSVSASR